VRVDIEQRTDKPIVSVSQNTSWPLVASGSFCTFKACKKRLKTWDQVEYMLSVNCKPLLKKPIETITRKQLRDLCKGFDAEGTPYKATNTYAYLSKMYRWATTEELIKTNVLAGIDKPKFGKRKPMLDEQITALWRAADQLDPVHGAYLKLLILLAPRKTALALMRHRDLDSVDDPKLWTTPPELVKGPKQDDSDDDKARVYLTPLPPLAVRILKPLLKPGADPDALVFPGLTIGVTKAEQRQFNTVKLVAHLAKLGAPGSCRIVAGIR
jgi:integrase